MILTRTEVERAIRLGWETADFYRRHPERANGQPVADMGTDNDRGAVAEFGAREFWGLPHDGADRIGKPDLGRLTDVKSIRLIGHRLMIPANQFHRERRYLIVFADVRTGEVRIQGAVWGSWIWANRERTFNPTGRDTRTNVPRPCWEVNPADFDVQPADVRYLEAWEL